MRWSVKIAHQIDYVVKANWKLVFENNRECYHCPPNHKEYNTAAYDVQRDMAMLDPSLQPGMDAIVARANARFRTLGLDEGDAMSTMTGTAFRCHRTPVMEGFVTQSMDGKPLCDRLMGRHQGVGLMHSRTTVFPNFSAAHELRLRRRRAADADRPLTRPMCAATGWSMPRPSRARIIRSTACCRSGT